MPLFGQRSATKAASQKDYFRLDKEAAKLQEKHQYAASEDFYRQALDTARRIEPEDNDVLQMATFNLGGVLFDQKRYAEAEPLFSESCRYCEEGFGVDDLNGEFRNREYLTNVLIELGKYPEAETLLQKRLGSLRRQFGANNIATVIALAGLALVKRRQKMDAEADASAREAIDTVTNEPNLTDADRKEVLDSLTTFLADHGGSYQERKKDLFLKCFRLARKEVESGKIQYQGNVQRCPLPQGLLMKQILNHNPSGSGSRSSVGLPMRAGIPDTAPSSQRSKVRRSPKAIAFVEAVSLLLCR